MTEKWVDSWDDPRLLTLAGLRRKGVTSTAINAFVRGMGITRRLELVVCLVYVHVKICQLYLMLHFVFCCYHNHLMSSPQ